MRSSAGPLLNLLARLLAALPRSAVRWLGSLIGILWFDVFRLRRDVVLSNLDIAFPERDRGWKIRTGRTALRRFGANTLEFFTLPALDEKWIARHVVFEGWEHLEAAKAKGKGVYLLSLHMGPYDIAASLMPMRGQETVLISKFMKNRAVNDLWFSVRGAQGMKFIEPHGDKTAFDILKAIKRNAGVIFVLDQFMGPPYGIETTFFGRKTGTAYGLALFAMKTGSPVLPVYSYEGKDGKLHLVFRPEIPLADLITGNKDESLLKLTQRFNDETESIVRAHPEEWLWVHKRWKDFHD